MSGFFFFHTGTEDDCTACLNSLTSAAQGSAVPSKGNVTRTGKKEKNVLGKPVTSSVPLYVFYKAKVWLFLC